MGSIYISNAVEGPYRRINRRGFLLYLLPTVVTLGAIAIGTTDNPIIRSMEESAGDAPHEDRYFRVLRRGDNLYIEKSLGDEIKVFRVEQVSPSAGSGIQQLVKTKNPKYDKGAIKLVGEVANQLYQNPNLKDLKDGEIVKIPYQTKPTLKLLENKKYPVPIEINKRNLEELMM